MKSVMDSGSDGVLIEAECHLSNGLPSIVIVGFANKAIDEAKERIRASFTSAAISLPKKRITLNLAPADLPKDGTSFDLAMALSILDTSNQIDGNKIASSLVVGELGLKGDIRPVRGIIGKILAGIRLGYTCFVIPEDNLEQAKLVPNIEIITFKNLNQAYMCLSGASEIKIVRSDGGEIPTNKISTKTNYPDLSQVVGQSQAKRALVIAAAGGHNVLLSGQPGAGKSMLAKCLPSILPDMNKHEILEITHIHSLASKNFDKIVTERPFRSPHHSSSDTSIIGGGQKPKPGEISLSHLGVLFLDELPEYSRSTIEAMRQPLEDGEITVARAKDSSVFPANFLMIATANPCPCGYFGSNKECKCTLNEIVRYQKKLSGPIMDRIDLFVSVEAVDHEKLLSSSDEKTSPTIRKQVSAAREVQKKRLNSNIRLNSNMNNEEIKTLAFLSDTAQELLNQASAKLDVSARAYMRTIKVARSIADLEGSQTILPSHIAEALSFRYLAQKI